MPRPKQHSITSSAPHHTTPHHTTPHHTTPHHTTPHHTTPHHTAPHHTSPPDGRRNHQATHHIQWYLHQPVSVHTHQSTAISVPITNLLPLTGQSLPPVAAPLRPHPAATSPSARARTGSAHPASQVRGLAPRAAGVQDPGRQLGRLSRAVRVGWG